MRLGLVRQSASGGLKFAEGPLVIAIAIIIRETECEMTFGKVRLQSQSLLRIETRFLPPARCRIEAVIRPALHHGESGKSRGKVWNELDRLLQKRLSLQRCVVKHVHSIGEIVCLNEKEIGVRILGWSLIETCFFIGRKLGLESGSNFLREVGLDGEYVGQIAVVILRPNLLFVFDIDKLHFNPHPISVEPTLPS